MAQTFPFVAVERTPDGLRPEMLGKLFENANYLLLRPSLAKRDPIVVASFESLFLPHAVLFVTFFFVNRIRLGTLDRGNKQWLH